MVELQSSILEMNRVRQYNSQTGLTLLEVMLAVTIIGLGIIPLLVTHSASIRHLVRSREVTRGGLLAQERISLRQADGFIEEAAAATGQFEDHPYLEWEERISSIRPGLMAEIEVRVRPAVEVALKTGRGVELLSFLVNPRFAPSKEGLGEEQTATSAESTEAIAEVSSFAPSNRGPDQVDFRPVPIPLFTPYTPQASDIRPDEISNPVPTFSPLPAGRDDGLMPPPGVPVPLMTPYNDK